MSSKILVAYATHAGSTAEVAQAIADEIIKRDMKADVLPLDQVRSFAGYDGAVIGGPMIMGWHRGARQFLRKHRNELSRIPVAIFVTAMSLIRTGATSVDGVPVYIDDKLPKSPLQEGKLTWRERYAQVSNYARPIIASLRPVKPTSIGFFGGRLEYGRLKWWAVLFAMVVVQAPAGDKRNWNAIRAWAADTASQFKSNGRGQNLKGESDHVFTV